MAMRYGAVPVALQARGLNDWYAQIHRPLDKLFKKITYFYGFAKTEETKMNWCIVSLHLRAT
jgi:hypothetical protein